MACVNIRNSYARLSSVAFALGATAERRAGQTYGGFGKDAQFGGSSAESEAAFTGARVIKGDAYKVFLKDNEVSTRTLMGW